MLLSSQRTALRRGRVLTATLLALLALSVAAMHSGVMSDHGSMSEVVAVCLAVTGTVALAGGLAAGAEKPSWGVASRLLPAAPAPGAPRRLSLAFARDGPAHLQVFLL